MRLLFGAPLMTLCFGVASPGAGVANPPLIISASGEAAPILYPSADNPAIVRALKTWNAFFAERGVTAQIAKTGQLDFPGKGAVLAFETETACPLAQAIGLDISALKSARDEAHILTVRTWKERPLLLVVGKTSAGTDAGAEQLLSKVGYKLAPGGGWTVTCAPFDAVRNPFYRGREATLCPTGRAFPKQPEWINYEHWDKARLELYPPYLKACGFNSMQLMELITYHAATKTWDKGYRDGISKGLSIDDIQKTLHILADAAHAQGMTVSQYIWGSPADGNKWADPATRPARQAFYDELARRYGSKVDHIITHWVDEGDEPGFETPLPATVYLQEAYRKYNPNVRATCDAWWNPKLYDGIDDEKYAPKSIGIAMGRWYDAAEAERIVKAGRRVGIWGWYFSDFEMIYGSFLYSKTIDKYFNELPAKAGEQVDWFCTEMCFHALPSGVNLYIVAQKMWDPKRPMHEILMDYYSAVYGPANAKAMSLVYETVEEGQKEVRYGMVEQDRYPVVLGTPQFKEKVDHALKALDSVCLPKGWKPNFALVATPEDTIAHLRKSLEKFAGEPVK